MIPATANTLRTIGGVVLSAAWIAGSVVIFSLSMFGVFMANDAGSVSASAQTAMILLVLGGQVVAGTAGLPLGLACFWRKRRKILLVTFAALLGLGLLLQIAGIFTFVSNAPH